MVISVLFFAFFATVYADPFIEAQDPSMKDNAPEFTNVKRQYCSIRCSYGRYCQSGYYCDYYRCCRPNNQRSCSHHAHCPQGWYCDYSSRLCKVGERRCSHPYHCSRGQVCVDGKCRKRECYYHNQCKQGYYCASGICKALPGACTSDSGCKDTQCCSKYHLQQTHGKCRELKKPNEFCPMKPDGYHCGCTEGYECKRYHNNYYWGQCKKKPPPPCSSDDSCQKTHCCSGGKCKPRKKAKEFCPHKGADIYHCGCIEGYYCKQYEDNNYWGRCEPGVPPTEEPGSGVGE